MTVPADIVNRALDAIGRTDLIIGDLQEGTEGARPALRAYLPAIRQLIRGARWDWSRKHVPLQLLGDATGQTTGAGTLVLPPWRYCYALPTDCEKVRFVPWNSQQEQPNPPVSQAFQNPPLNTVRLIPAPYLVTMDVNYPPMPFNPTTWADVPNWASTNGTGPTTRTVICTNVKCAWAVYSAFTPYPSQWDSLFEEALVQLLASRLAMPLAKDPRMAMGLMKQATESGKRMLSIARANAANESGFPQSTDMRPDWMGVRNAGGGFWGGFWGGGFGLGPLGGGGAGAWGGGYGGYEGVSFGDGSVY